MRGGFRRLLPAAALVLAAMVVGVAVFPQDQWPHIAREIAAAALYAENLFLAHHSVDYLAFDRVASSVQHHWSLSVEKQFYLVWPMLLLAAVGCRRIVGWPARVWYRAAIVIALLGSLGLLLLAGRHPQPGTYLYSHLRVWELALGGLIACLPAQWGGSRPERRHRCCRRQGWRCWSARDWSIRRRPSSQAMPRRCRRSARRSRSGRAGTGAAIHCSTIGVDVVGIVLFVLLLAQLTKTLFEDRFRLNGGARRAMRPRWRAFVPVVVAIAIPVLLAAALLGYVAWDKLRFETARLDPLDYTVPWRWSRRRQFRRAPSFQPRISCRRIFRSNIRRGAVCRSGRA